MLKHIALLSWRAGFRCVGSYIAVVVNVTTTRPIGMLRPSFRTNQIGLVTTTRLSIATSERACRGSANNVSAITSAYPLRLAVSIVWGGFNHQEAMKSLAHEFGLDIFHEIVTPAASAFTTS